MVNLEESINQCCVCKANKTKTMNYNVVFKPTTAQLNTASHGYYKVCINDVYIELEIFYRIQERGIYNDN